MYFGKIPQSSKFVTEGFTSNAAAYPTGYPLAHNPGSSKAIDVIVGGAVQRADVDYTMTAQKLVFSPALPDGLSIYVIYRGLQSGLYVPQDGSITPVKLVGTTLAKDVSGSGASITLTAAEAANSVYNFSGARTAVLTVIVPNDIRDLLVLDNTTGGFAITVKTAAGNGVTLLSGVPAGLYCDGSSVYFNNGLGVTPAQFNSSKQLATMEALQRALGNYAGSELYGASATLNATDAGKMIVAQGSVPITLTLPLLADVADGTVIYVKSASLQPVTVERQGTDLILVKNGTNPTSLALTDGDDLIITKNAGASKWVLSGGSAALRYATGDFGSLLAANGYQKLPSGLIVQWMIGTTSASAQLEVTFPIAFTTTSRVVAQCGAATMGTITSQASATPATSVLLNGWNQAGARAALAFTAIALGY